MSYVLTALFKAVICMCLFLCSLFQFFIGYSFQLDLVRSFSIIVFLYWYPFFGQIFIHLLSKFFWIQNNIRTYGQISSKSKKKRMIQNRRRMRHVDAWEIKSHCTSSFPSASHQFCHSVLGIYRRCLVGCPFFTYNWR